MPPRVDDRTRPDRAYETFRGALARDELRREYECLDESLKREFGVRSSGQWSDMRAVVLRPSHIVVRGIKSSKVKGVEFLGPNRNRARVDLSFPFGIKGRVWMRRRTVIRIYVYESEQPLIYDYLPGMAVEVKEGKVVFPALPGVAGIWAQELRGKTQREVRVGHEWFLEQFEIGGETPKDAKKQREEAAP